MKGLGDIVKDLREMNTGLIRTLDALLVSVNNMVAEQRETNQLLKDMQNG